MMFLKDALIHILYDNITVPKNLFFEQKITFADIGASSLNDNYQLLNYKFCEVSLFEPDLRVLSSYFPVKKNFRLYDIGLWSKKTNKKIFLFKNQAASSFFEPNLSILDKFKLGTDQYKIKELKKIKLNKLDNLKNKKIFDFIKVDAEGSDYHILYGSKKMLRSTLGVQVEVQNIERYKKSPIYFKVLEFLYNNGFDVFIYNKEFWSRNKNYNISTNFQNIWADVVFFKRSDLLVSNLKKESKNSRLLKVKKIIFLMMHYKLHDSALSYLLIMKKNKIIGQNDFLNLKRFILKNTKSNTLIIFKDLLRLLLILLLLPFSLLNFYKYLKILINFLIKNLNNFKRLFEIINDKNVFRNKGIN